MSDRILDDKSSSSLAPTSLWHIGQSSMGKDGANICPLFYMTSTLPFFNKIYDKLI